MRKNWVGNHRCTQQNRDNETHGTSQETSLVVTASLDEARKKAVKHPNATLHRLPALEEKTNIFMSKKAQCAHGWHTDQRHVMLACSSNQRIQP